MQSQNNFRERLTPKNLAILFLIVFLLVPVILGVVFMNREAIDVEPKDSSESDYTYIVHIHDGIDVLRALGGGARFNAISRDLMVYARLSFDEYKNEDKVVGFKLDGPVNIDEDKNAVGFSGRFGASKDLIVVSVDLLDNNRMKVAIINNKNDTSYNSELPSNSKRNQYIATLPVINNNYKVDFSTTDDKILLNIFYTDDNVYAQAIEELKQATGESDVNPEWLSVSFTTSEPAPSQEFITDEFGNVIPLESS